MISLAAHLELQGFDAISADIWGEFIGGVIAALLEAEKSLKTAGAWKEFCGAVGAFGKPRKRGVHKNKALPSEEAISGELADRMNDFLRTTDEGHVLRKWHVSFDCEGRVRSRHKKGKFASRTDIRARGLRPDGPEFVLEAKFVDTKGEIRSRLLGPTGLGCFVSDEPYTTADIAGLMAYTVRGEEDLWQKHIGSGYTTPPPISTVSESVILDPTKLVALCVPVSRKATQTPILMLNIVMKFRTNPA